MAPTSKIRQTSPSSTHICSYTCSHKHVTEERVILVTHGLDFVLLGMTIRHEIKFLNLNLKGIQIWNYYFVLEKKKD